MLVSYNFILLLQVLAALVVSSATRVCRALMVYPVFRVVSVLLVSKEPLVPKGKPETLETKERSEPREHQGSQETLVDKARKVKGNKL